MVGGVDSFALAGILALVWLRFALCVSEAE